MKNLAQFVRTHEKALANALQLHRQAPKNGQATTPSGDTSPTKVSDYQNSNSSFSTSSALAAAISLGSLTFSSHNIKPAKLGLTPHHLYYLLDRFESDMGIPIGPMNVRLENIHTEASPANYVSFLGQSQSRSDRDSIHSVSSVRSVMSGMSSLWSGFGLGSSSSATKTEKAKLQLLTDLKYLYSAFTKIPCLRLSPDRKAHLIGGYEEFPFDTAVPLLAFKNVSALEICDVDFRIIFGWHMLSEQLRSLTVKRSHLDDPTDLFVNIVLDDMEKRRRRSSKTQRSPVLPWLASPCLHSSEIVRPIARPDSPMIDGKLGHSESFQEHGLQHQNDQDAQVSRKRPRTKSTSPSRPSSSRQDNAYRHTRGNPPKMKRSGSNSSNSSTYSSGPNRSGSFSNLLTMGILPASKWRFLRHLSLADNSLTSMTPSSLAPLSNTLHSLDLSSNLFAEMPDCLVTLTALRALNVSNCMIQSLHSLTRNPLPAINALNLRANRLVSIAGVEGLLSLERLDLRDNRIHDPTELARLTGIPDIHEIWLLRNPFVKTHTTYRVTIFNLFRNTPGYSEDVLIDSTGPGYSERKQLRDRTVEQEGVPVVKSTPAEPTPSFPLRYDTMIDTKDPGEAHGVQRPSLPQYTKSEITVGSGRRRKGPQRRIVDLALDQSPSILHQQIPLELPQEHALSSSTDISMDVVYPRTKPSLLPPLQMSATTSRTQPFDVMEISEDRPLEISETGRSLASEIQSLNLNGEAYKQKVEALKNEVGSNWLRILSGEDWSNLQRLEAAPLPFHHVTAMRPEAPAFRASSRGITSGHRTLG